MTTEDLQKLTPKQHLAEVRKMLDRHILACPTSPERDAITEASIALSYATGETE